MDNIFFCYMHIYILGLEKNGKRHQKAFVTAAEYPLLYSPWVENRRQGSKARVTSDCLSYCCGIIVRQRQGS